MIKRTFVWWIAYAAATLSVGLAFTFVKVIYSLRSPHPINFSHPEMEIILLVVAVVFFAALPGTVLVYLFLKHWDAVNLVNFGIGGGIVGGSMAILLPAIMSGSRAVDGTFVLIFAGFGLLAGAVFWTVQRLFNGRVGE